MLKIIYINKFYYHFVKKIDFIRTSSKLNKIYISNNIRTTYIENNIVNKILTIF